MRKVFLEDLILTFLAALGFNTLKFNVVASTFKCNHQGNTYSTDCENTQLDCFTTSINGDELTLTM